MTDQPAWTITSHGQRRGMTYDHLGFIPSFLSLNDPRPAREQIDERYSHGGGWSPTKIFVFGGLDEPFILGSGERHQPLAECRLREERIFYYDMSFVVIVQPDGVYEVSRMD